MAKSDWREIDVQHELTDEMRELYLRAKAIYRDYKAARDAFEGAMQEANADALSDDEELKFGYNFGKLSVAVGEKRERKPKKEAQAKQSFGDWIKAQREGGHNH